MDKLVVEGVLGVFSGVYEVAYPSVVAHGVFHVTKSRNFGTKLVPKALDHYLSCGMALSLLLAAKVRNSPAFVNLGLEAMGW